jgi:hypothetical protein
LKPTHKAGQKLQQTIKAIRGRLLVFVTNRELEATNNGSERALPPCAVHRKITNGFRSEWGAKFHADIRSVVEAARRRANHAVDAIRITLPGQRSIAPLDRPGRNVSNYPYRRRNNPSDIASGNPPFAGRLCLLCERWTFCKFEKRLSYAIPCLPSGVGGLPAG